MLRRYSAQRIELFPVSQNLLERRRAAIAAAAHAFFQRTSLRDRACLGDLVRQVDEYHQIYFDSPIDYNPDGINFSFCLRSVAFSSLRSSLKAAYTKACL
jgi:hypothetical protein